MTFNCAIQNYLYFGFIIFDAWVCPKVQNIFNVYFTNKVPWNYKFDAISWFLLFIHTNGLKGKLYIKHSNVCSMGKEGIFLINTNNLMCEHQSTWSNGSNLLQHNMCSKKNER